MPITMNKLTKHIQRHGRKNLEIIRRYCHRKTSDPSLASLYVHWPYCVKRCTYCNFNKYISKDVDEIRMRECLMKETETLLQLSHVSHVTSVFFGGGTPSLAEPETLEGILATVQNHCHLAADTEITLEVNPTKVQIAKLRDFKSIGVNRVSLGIQALNDADLRTLGRDHTAKQAVRSINDARDLFPGRTSVDIIFGRPGHDLGSWTDELSQVLNICDDHLSLYQLTLERGTQLFKDVANGTLTVPDADVMADLYRSAHKILEENNFKRYEASNFSRSGASSSHNRWYWAGGQYVGVGPGAHGRFSLLSGQREARIQTLEPIPWMREVEKHGHATRKVIPMSQIEQLEELLMLGLRTSEGIPSQRWLNFCPEFSLLNIFGDFLEKSDLVRLQLMDLSDRGMRCTDRGLDVVDSITPLLINCLNDFFVNKPS